MNKFYKTDIEEQETIINVDYSKKETVCYSCRKTQIERLIKKLGVPKKIYYINKKICGAKWIIPFTDNKRMNVIFSKSIIIGQL